MGRDGQRSIISRQLKLATRPVVTAFSALDFEFIILNPDQGLKIVDAE
jgi:hypothetical protein